MCDSHQKEEDNANTSERALFLITMSFRIHSTKTSVPKTLNPQSTTKTTNCVLHISRMCMLLGGSAEFQVTRVLPGSEPAAIVGDDGTSFVRCGRYDIGDHVFGCSSVSPLSEYLSAAELAEVVHQVNGFLLREEGEVFGWRNLVACCSICLRAVCGAGFWGPFFPRPVFQESLALEQYVAQLNSPGGLLHERGVRLVLPRRSGCLSLISSCPDPNS
ncbi:CMF_HP2_G0043520.mRNA.1.CDS.1 [Saccharomyces cerevisiae]|nr:CMF_HP2_G0043520.mRNA.1.CDS.1 [Saccharomyces cerevisiae]CAI6718650.1 CMF_HP2_G0043520.mRNA.1.CDS.1 [Saccharomyces cerevisiae]